MNVKIGDTIKHGDHEFVIVDIRLDENMEGETLYIRACDSNMADKEQQKSIKVDQMSQNFIEMLKKISEGGGFNIGGFRIDG